MVRAMPSRAAVTFRQDLDKCAESGPPAGPANAPCWAPLAGVRDSPRTAAWSRRR